MAGKVKGTITPTKTTKTGKKTTTKTATKSIKASKKVNVKKNTTKTAKDFSYQIEYKGLGSKISKVPFDGKLKNASDSVAGAKKLLLEKLKADYKKDVERIKGITTVRLRKK